MTLLILAFIIGFLGAYAGSENTSLLWRRCGIPVIFTMCALIATMNIYTFFLMSLWGWFSIGYGIPDATDEGSTIGRFWYNIFNNKFLTDIFTRGTVALGICFSFSIMPILKGNWLIYFIGCIQILFIYMYNSWRGYGVIAFKIKEKNYQLCYSDIVTYMVLGISGLLILFK